MQTGAKDLFFNKINTIFSSYYDFSITHPSAGHFPRIKIHFFLLSTWTDDHLSSSSLLVNLTASNKQFSSVKPTPKLYDHEFNIQIKSYFHLVSNNFFQNLACILEFLIKVSPWAKLLSDVVGGLIILFYNLLDSHSKIW